SRRDLDGKFDLAGLQPPLQLAIRRDRGMLAEIARVGELIQVLAALRRAVMVQHGVGQVFDVEGDPVAEEEHKDHWQEHGERQSYRVAANFNSFAPGVGPHPRQAEPPEPPPAVAVPSGVTTYRGRSFLARRLGWFRRAALWGGGAVPTDRVLE